MDLRDEISSIVQEYDPDGPGCSDSSVEIADRILDLPEIKEALAIYEQYLDGPSGPALTTPDEVRAHFAKIRAAARPHG